MDIPDNTIFSYITAGFTSLLGYFGVNLHNRQSRIEEKMQQYQTKADAVRLETKIDNMSQALNDINVSVKVVESKMQNMPKRSTD